MSDKIIYTTIVDYGDGCIDTADYPDDGCFEDGEEIVIITKAEYERLKALESTS